MRTRGRQCTWPCVAVLVALMALGVPLSGLLAAGTHSDGRTGAGRASTLATGPPFWLPVASMHTRRDSFAAALGTDGRIYAIGGYNNRDGGLASVEAFSVGISSWSAAPPLPSRRYAHVAAPGADGRIYVISGLEDPQGPVSPPTEAYRPSQEQWVSVASPPNLPVGAASVAGPDGRLYVLGGGSADVYADVQVYTPRTNHWSRMATLPTARVDLAAATGNDGRIYALGGNASRDIQLPLRVVEAYTPRTNRWARVAALPVARAGLAAATGADGRIYALGGNLLDVLHHRVATVDAYDPRTNRWSSVASMRTPRATFAAVRGADGRLYAIGGFTGYTSPGHPMTITNWLNTVEAYGPSIHLAPHTAVAASTVVLSGTNFAASAMVSVSWGSVPGGTVLATGRTDHRGNLLHALRVRVPAGVRPGQYGVTAMDNRSRYPVTAVLNVRRPALK